MLVLSRLNQNGIAAQRNVCRVVVVVVVVVKGQGTFFFKGWTRGSLSFLV